MNADILPLLRSKNAKLLFLGCALIAQMPHAAGLFHRYSPAVYESGIGYYFGWGYAALFAFSLEMAILNFVLAGRKDIAGGFAVVSILVNLGYYYSPKMLYTPEGVFDPDIAWILCVCLLSVMLPSAITFYSEDVSQEDTLVYRQVSPLVNILSDTQSGTPPAKSLPDDTQPSTRKLAFSAFAEGHTDQQIAEMYGANISTIKTYRQQYKRQTIAPTNGNVHV